MSDINKEWLNKKYEPLPGEFLYKNTVYCAWTKLEFIQKIENDDMFNADDTLLATYPKSGTTVTEEIIWLINNNVDIEKAKKTNIIWRFLFMEENYNHIYPTLNFTGRIIDILDKLEGPRFLKTHLRYLNLEAQITKNPEMKVITCLRNPKDTAVSMYYFYKGVPFYGPYKGSWDNFFERWIDGWIAGGDWLDVVTEWWNQSYKKNLKIIFYEDIVSDPKKVIEELCTFFNKDLTDEDIERIIEHTTFKNMKENPATNYEFVKTFEKGFSFMRNGKVGDWKNYFTDEQSKRLDEKYYSVLKKCGLNFTYE